MSTRHNLIRTVITLVIVLISCHTNGREELNEAVISDQKLYFNDIVKLWDKRYRPVEANLAYNKQALILDEDRNPVDVVIRRTDALLKDLGVKIGNEKFKRYCDRLKILIEESGKLPPLKLRTEKVKHLIKKYEIRTTATIAPFKEVEVEQSIIDNTGDYIGLFLDVCSLNREITFSNPLLDFKDILFMKKFPAFGHMVKEYLGNSAFSGGGVYILKDAFGSNPDVKDVIGSAEVKNGRLAGKCLTNNGAFNTLELSYDAKTVYFAYVESPKSVKSVRTPKNTETVEGKNGWWDEHNVYHIFKINIYGKELEMLTDGPWNDFDPCPLPNGRIAFISERRGGQGRCHPWNGPTFVLHSMYPDGSDITAISYHEINEWTPRVNNSGEIVYTRWDYVDRANDFGQFPWITKPDGRDARSLYGNYDRRGGYGLIQADLRQAPRSNIYFGIEHGHHSNSYGTLIAYDPSIPDDDKTSCAKVLTPDAGEYEPVDSMYSKFRGAYASPYPLSDKYFLCVYSPDALKCAGAIGHYTSFLRKAGKTTSHGIYLTDVFGNRNFLYRDDSIGCYSPIPLKPRTIPPVISHAVSTAFPLSQKNDPRDPNDSKKEAVLGLMNVYNSLYPWPNERKIKSLRIIQILPKSTIIVDKPRIAAWKECVARRVLGDVPVEVDGSAYFKVPPKICLSFQALDENGMAIQIMRSNTYAQPGEMLTCNGCHEPKSQAPQIARSSAPIAFKRPPSEIKPGPEGSNPLTFPRLVQPVLDKHCVECHKKNNKAPVLSGEISEYEEKTTKFSEAYVSLTIKKKTIWNNACDWEFLQTRSKPGKVGAYVSPLYKLLTSGSHKDKVKLKPEEMARITTWLDCMAVFYGAYNDTDKQLIGKVVMPDLE